MTSSSDTKSDVVGAQPVPVALIDAGEFDSVFRPQSAAIQPLAPDEVLLQSQVRWLDIECLGYTGEQVEGADFELLFASLHGLGHRLVVFVRGAPEKVSISLGIVVMESHPDRLDPTHAVDAVERHLRARFPGSLPVRRYWSDVQTRLESLAGLQYFGALVGQPSVADEEDCSLRSPLGGLLQALPDRDLAFIVIADPLDGPSLSAELERTSDLLQVALTASKIDIQETRQVARSSLDRKTSADESSRAHETRTSRDASTQETTTTGFQASLEPKVSFAGVSIGLGSVTGSRQWSRGETESLGRSLVEGRVLRQHQESSQEHGETATQTVTLRREVGDVRATLAAELLETERTRLLRGLSGGAWQVGVYLAAADRMTLHTAGGILVGLLAGSQSLQRPLRFLPLSAEQIPHARQRLMSLQPWRLAESGRDWYRTLLNNQELAETARLPVSSVPGFEVRQSVEFGQRVPLTASDRVVEMGCIYSFGRSLTERRVEVDVDSLTMHCLVCGTTGAGKTTTVIHLLDRLWHEHQIPFLVVDPKEEYADRLRELVPGLQVLGPTQEGWRLNPFQVVPGRNVGLHAEQLRDLFCASFETEAAMPELILQAILEVYRRRGWDLRRNAFTGVGDPSFPTLTDLQNEVRRTVARNGFEATLESNYRAAIGSRIRSLRSGWKGDLLDGRESAGAAAIFDRPTVLDVGQMDSTGRAFLMGLLVLRLNALRRADRGGGGRLRHVLVLEEAHHLLRSPTSLGSSTGGARSHALESLANAIAELRAFGQGIVIADQSPQELHPAVLRGTNLKIVHRLIEGRDQDAVAESIGLDESQRRALATLPAGRAVVRAVGWEKPVAVEIHARGVTPGAGEAERSTRTRGT